MCCAERVTQSMQLVCGEVCALSSTAWSRTMFSVTSYSVGDREYDALASSAALFVHKEFDFMHSDINSKSIVCHLAIYVV